MNTASHQAVQPAMKCRLPLPLALVALASVLLLSSCVYDPLYPGSGYYGASYGTSYGVGDYGYSGGYYNGVYSDFFVGYHNDSYRYRHTRCRHCNHYPCRGGHTTNYYTFHRNYRAPLHRHARHSNRGPSHIRKSHSTRANYGGGHGGGSYRDYDGRTGNRSGRYTGSDRRRASETSRGARGRSEYGTLRNSSGYRSGRSEGSNRRAERPHPATVTSTSPTRTTPRLAPRRETTVRRTESPSRRSSSSSSSSHTKTKTKSSSTPTRNVGRNYGRSSSAARPSGGSTRNVGRRYRSQ